MSEFKQRIEKAERAILYLSVFGWFACLVSYLTIN